MRVCQSKNAIVACVQRQTHLSKVLCDLEDETLATRGLDVKSVEDCWEVIGVKVNVDDWTNDGLDETSLLASGWGSETSGLDWCGLGKVAWESSWSSVRRGGRWCSCCGAENKKCIGVSECW